MTLYYGTVSRDLMLLVMETDAQEICMEKLKILAINPHMQH
jgi:hypothetical protein